jgi:hypothetical protein
VIGCMVPSGAGNVEKFHARTPEDWTYAYSRPSLLPANTKGAALLLPVAGVAEKPCWLGAWTFHASDPENLPTV